MDKTLETKQRGCLTRDREGKVNGKYFFYADIARHGIYIGVSFGALFIECIRSDQLWGYCVYAGRHGVLQFVH